MMLDSIPMRRDDYIRLTGERETCQGDADGFCILIPDFEKDNGVFKCASLWSYNPIDRHSIYVGFDHACGAIRQGFRAKRRIWDSSQFMSYRDDTIIIKNRDSLTDQDMRARDWVILR